MLVIIEKVYSQTLWGNWWCQFLIMPYYHVNGANSLEDNNPLQSLTRHIIVKTEERSFWHFNTPEVEVSVSDWSEAPSGDQRVSSCLHEAVGVHKQAVVVHRVSGAHSVQVPEHVVREAHRSARVRSGLQAYNQCRAAWRQMAQSVGGRAVECAGEALLPGAARVLEGHWALRFWDSRCRGWKDVPAPEHSA